MGVEVVSQGGARGGGPRLAAEGSGCPDKRPGTRPTAHHDDMFLAPDDVAQVGGFEGPTMPVWRELHCDGVRAATTRSEALVRRGHYEQMMPVSPSTR